MSQGGAKAETASRYRKRAEELRTIAADLHDKEGSATLLKVAEEYERMAQHAIEMVSMTFPEAKPRKSH